jgi:hypothetical protein
MEENDAGVDVKVITSNSGMRSCLNMGLFVGHLPTLLRDVTMSNQSL